MEEDSLLIARFKNGDLGGFELLVQRYQDMVINLVFGLTANRHDAEDVAQEVFMKVHDNIGSFRGESKFSSWLYRVSVNCAYDSLRRRKGPHVSFEDLENVDIAEHKQADDPLAKELIRLALKKLPVEYRTTVILRELEGLSYEEISGILRVSIGTVESRLFRGRALLKDILMKKGVAKDAL